VEDGLDLEADRHLLADYGAATGLSVDGEVAPVDLRGGGKAGPMAAVRIRAEAVYLDGERHGPGDAVQRQLSR
jgi:hypothetical protein